MPQAVLVPTVLTKQAIVCQVFFTRSWEGSKQKTYTEIKARWASMCWAKPVGSSWNMDEDQPRCALRGAESEQESSHSSISGAGRASFPVWGGGEGGEGMEKGGHPPPNPDWGSWKNIYQSIDTSCNNITTHSDFATSRRMKEAQERPLWFLALQTESVKIKAKGKIHFLDHFDQQYVFVKSTAS